MRSRRHYTKWGVLVLFSWLTAVLVVTTVLRAPVSLECDQGLDLHTQKLTDLGHTRETILKTKNELIRRETK